MTFNTAEHSGGKVCNNYNLFADKVLGAVPFSNTRSYCTGCFCAVIKGELKELFGTFNGLAIYNLTYTKLNLCKIIVNDFCKAFDFTTVEREQN